MYNEGDKSMFIMTPRSRQEQTVGKANPLRKTEKE